MRKTKRAVQPGSQEHEFEAQLLTNGNAEQPKPECQTEKATATLPAAGVFTSREEPKVVFLVALGFVSINVALGDLSIDQIASSDTFYGNFMMSDAFSMEVQS